MCQVCGRKKQARGRFGACRSNDCLQTLQKRAMKQQNIEVDKDKRDPAVGMGPVRVNGRGKFEVQRSDTVKINGEYVHGYRLTTGKFFPLDMVEEI